MCRQHGKLHPGLLTLFLFIILTLSGCGSDEKDEITSIDQLDRPDCVIGVGLDCPEEKLLRSQFPDAKLVQYKDNLLAIRDVADNRLDAVVYARVPMELALANGTTGVRILDENYCNNPVAVGISPKTEIIGLRDKLNDFIDEIQDDGTMNDMFDRWVTKLDWTMPEIPQAEDPSIKLVVGTVGTIEPYSFYSGTELSGLDIEMAYRFAAWLGAEVEFKTYDFNGIIAAAQSGDVDCIMSNLYFTPEHAESIPFSDIVYYNDIAVLVSDCDAVGANGEVKGFASSVRDSFEKTFIREGRWRLFLQGLITTVVITIFSIIFGTVLGFSLFMLCRNGNPFANAVTRICIRLVEGLPVVVLLMMLYYIIFGGLSVSGTTVSVVCFSLVFGAAVFGMIRTGVNAIDRGQLEAAYTLGYSDLKAFFRIVFPQALPLFMPSYKTEVTSVIKATAVVGYIAVQDLTKMGDIVRTRTYEAFFPLISVAVIYFALAGFMTFLVNRIELRIDPRKRDPEEIRREVER